MFLAHTVREQMAKERANYAQINTIQFDELQTIEHTKCKPVSVAVAVSKKERKILGIEVSQMPATGHLAAISRKKYGKRADNRVVERGKQVVIFSKKDKAFFEVSAWSLAC